jgi:hypothetical protein
MLVASGALLVLAGAWALVDIGPRGPILLDLGGHHGIHAIDLLAVPLVFAAAGCFNAGRRRSVRPNED